MRTPAFRAFERVVVGHKALVGAATWASRAPVPAQERGGGLGARAIDRRRFLLGAGAAGAALAAWRPTPLVAQSVRSVAIVGAGLAGLMCADRLRGRGIAADVYDAADRVGGRCVSLPGVFPGQVGERGGELIDNLHKTMLGLAKRFGATLEDYEKQPGDVSYNFDGTRWSESAVVDELRDFVGAMRADLRSLSAEPSADRHTPADVQLDRMSLEEYLASRGAGRVITKAVEAAYMAEYGLAIGEQSALNFLLFIHADRRSRFTPFGVQSDERYHLVGGNDAVVRGLAGDLDTPVRLGHWLRRVGRSSDGRVALSFDTAGGPVERRVDHAVITLPFSVLRDIEIDDAVGVPEDQRRAIDGLGYGTCAKLMVGFDGPFWRAAGASGASYSDLPNHQTTWETNPTRAGAGGAVLTDYSSGARGVAVGSLGAQVSAQRFLGDLELVFPGAQAHVAGSVGQYRAFLEHWPSNPLARGCYTCYRPGQFTTMAGLEGRRAGPVHFAGEHANSFYEWQGFMEGACLSGLDAAEAILTDLAGRRRT